MRFLMSGFLHESIAFFPHLLRGSLREVWTNHKHFNFVNPSQRLKIKNSRGTYSSPDLFIHAKEDNKKSDATAPFKGLLHEIFDLWFL